MKKRKISFLAVVVSLLTFLGFVYLSQIIVGKKIEEKILEIFPQIAVESSVSGVFFSYREGIEIENISLDLQTGDNREARVQAEAIDASLSILDFLRSGNLQLRNLTTDALEIHLPMDFYASGEDFTDIIRTFITKIPEKNIIAQNFRLSIADLTIHDNKGRTIQLQPFSIAKNKEEYFEVGFYRGHIDTIADITYFKTELRDYSMDIFNSDVSHIHNRLIDVGTAPSKEKLQGLYDDIRSFSRSRNIYLRIGNISASPLYLSNLRLNAGFADRFTLETEFSSFYLHSHSLKNTSIKATETSDGALQITDLRTEQEDWGRIDLSGELYPFDDSLSTFSISGRTSSPALLLQQGGFTHYLRDSRGDYSLTGDFSGYLHTPSAGDFTGIITVSDFSVMPNPAVFSRTITPVLPKEIKCDSLILDSIQYSDSTFSAHLEKSVADTSILPPFRSPFIVSDVRADLREKTLEARNIQEYPFSLHRDTFFLNTSHMLLGLKEKPDTIITDTIFETQDSSLQGRQENEETKVDTALITDTLYAISLTHILLDTTRITAPEDFSLKNFIAGDPGVHLNLDFFSAMDSITISHGELFAPKHADTFTVHGDSLAYYTAENSHVYAKTVYSNTEDTLQGISLYFTDSDSLFRLDTLNAHRIILPEFSRYSSYTPSLEKFLLQAEQEISLPSFSDNNISIDALRIGLFDSTDFVLENFRLRRPNRSSLTFSCGSLLYGDTLRIRSAQGQFAVTDEILRPEILSIHTLNIHSAPFDIDSAENLRHNQNLHRLKRADIETFDITDKNENFLRGRKFNLTRTGENRQVITLFTCNFNERFHFKWGEFSLMYDESSVPVINYSDISQMYLHKTGDLNFADTSTEYTALLQDVRKKIPEYNSYLTEYLSENAQIRVGNFFVYSDTAQKSIARSITAEISPDSSSFSARTITLPSWHDMDVFETSWHLDDTALSLWNLRAVTEENTRFFVDEASVTLNPALDAVITARVENFKLSQIERRYFPESDVYFRGGGYFRGTLSGQLTDPDSFTGDRLSITLVNLRVRNLPLQKNEIIQRFAPPFEEVYFNRISMNPATLMSDRRLHLKYVEAQSPLLNFTGWGNLSSRGVFYFEMEGEVQKKTADRLPRLTRMALNAESSTEYGHFTAKLFGNTDTQHLVPEKGIHGRVIRSEFRNIGASFRQIFY